MDYERKGGREREREREERGMEKEGGLVFHAQLWLSYAQNEREGGRENRMRRLKERKEV